MRFDHMKIQHTNKKKRSYIQKLYCECNTIRRFILTRDSIRPFFSVRSFIVHYMQYALIVKKKKLPHKKEKYMHTRN